MFLIIQSQLHFDIVLNDPNDVDAKHKLRVVCISKSKFSLNVGSKTVVLFNISMPFIDRTSDHGMLYKVAANESSNIATYNPPVDWNLSSCNDIVTLLLILS